MWIWFFFQAEDGIRDIGVTGGSDVCSSDLKPNIRYGARKMLAQQCEAAGAIGAEALIVHPGHAEDGITEGVGRWTRTLEILRSEERRVGKECRSRWSPYH